MKRGDWLERIEALDPERDCVEIYRIVCFHEFTWDMSQSLSFALFRTFAVPSIGRLLAKTGAFTGDTQKRYDDTVLILDAILEHGFESAEGRAALRRMNQMHGAYDISHDDFVYVLSTFVVVPVRWLKRYGWHMGLRDLPHGYEGFATLLDAYERDHFGYDPGARRVADHTLDLMATFPPAHRLPRAWVRWVATGLFDGPLCDALGYAHPGPICRAVAGGGLWLRARVVRWLPARAEPRYARGLPNIRSYPDGYHIESLGTFPRTCPVPHAGPGRPPPG